MGGGPVGLGLAIELSRRGVDACVLERSTELHSIPKGQNLTQRSMEHMAVWDLEAAIRDARVLPTGFPSAGVNTFGAILSDLATPWFRRSDVSPFYWTDNERLPQYCTEAVLRDRAERVASVEYGVHVTGVEAGSDEAVAKHENGEIRARYVVGCDGAHSTVRTEAGISETRRDHDKRMVLLVARSPKLHRLIEERFGNVSFINSLHPDLDGYWQFLGRVDDSGTFFFHQPVTDDVDDPLPILRAAVGAEIEADILYLGYWDLRVTYADDYRAGRVFIAGDAAHSHPPYGGYGINTGFEDVRNLGWKLAAVIRGWADDSLLDTYTEERRAVFASTAEDLIEAFIERDRDFLALQPNPTIDDWTGRAGMTGVTEYAPHYSGSSLVVGGDGATSARAEHSHDVRAGHHLGPPVGNRDVFGLLGDDFTVVGRPSDERSVHALAAALSAAGVPTTTVLDPRWTAVAVVRPDHYVAAVGGGDPAAIAGTVAGRRG